MTSSQILTNCLKIIIVMTLLTGMSLLGHQVMQSLFPLPQLTVRLGTFSAWESMSAIWTHCLLTILLPVVVSVKLVEVMTPTGIMTLQFADELSD